MGSKLFVGGLSWNTDEHLLSGAFEKFGVVEEAKIITDRETGRSRGFGFVTFDSSDSADMAISQMDGTELDGRRIKVSHAQERSRDQGSGRGGFRGNRSPRSDFGGNRRF